MKFGKLEARDDPRTLRFASYLTPALPEPSGAIDQLSPVAGYLGLNDVTPLFPLDHNDTVGCCVVAGIAHAQTVYRGKARTRTVMPEADVLALYYQLTGGPDSGLYILDALKYWRQNPINGDQITAFAAVDHLNHDHVKLAAELFGGLLVGFVVQQDCIADWEQGTVWTPGPRLNEGHAAYLTGFDADTVTVLTWGRVQKGTWAWWDAHVDEVWALLSPQAASGYFAPGYDLAALTADLQAVTG